MSDRTTILVADDSFDSRQLLTRLLGQHVDAEIVEVRNGQDAIEEFERLRPDLTFLDIDMPDRSGIDVLREVRAGAPTAFVVMVTGVSSAQKVQEALALGVGGFVVKPYSARRIFDVVRKYEAESARRILREDA